MLVAAFRLTEAVVAFRLQYERRPCNRVIEHRPRRPRPPRRRFRAAARRPGKTGRQPPEVGMDGSARGRYEQRVRALAGFGHRGSCTTHERRAADYLAAQLRDLGLATALEPFAGYHALGTR